MTTAISTTSFIGTLGVNTHLDSYAYGYQNLSVVEQAIEYLGVVNLRDSASNAQDAALWQQISRATGVKFDDFIGWTSPAGMQAQLSYMPQLASEGILNYVEGGNEEDDSYPASVGNTLQITAQFQQQVYAMGQQLGLPVINMSFGAGWTAANNWQGDYGNVGNLSAYATYANAHTYPNVGQTADFGMQYVNGLAHLAAPSVPVITTEIGWDTNLGWTPTQVAQNVLDATMDGIKDGDVKTYFYALFNDGSGNFGLMNSDGTPTLAGTALHDLTSLLADPGATAKTFTPGSLNFTLSTSDNTVVMEKSDGTFLISVWNETTGSHSDTLTLPFAAQQIILYNPLTGTSVVQSASNTNTFTFTVPSSPVLVEIVGAGASDPPNPPAPPTTQPAAPPTTTTPSPTPDPVVTIRASETVGSGQTMALSGISISDPWAAGNPGTLALNLTATVGTIAMTDASGNTIAGSGTGAISVVGTLAQINADLANLTYTAGTANAAVTVDIWDQAGVEATKSIGVTVITADPVVTVPSSETVNAGETMALSGVSISDPWAAGNPGTLALNLTATAGTISMTDGSGNTIAGSGTGTISVAGTLAQINADLAHLTYTAGTANASVTVDIWDQAGVEATKSIGVTVITADPVVTVPSGETVNAGATMALSGVSISDPWAASNPGTLALNLTATAGTISMTDGSGNKIAGSGTGTISVAGTLAQINTDLANLSYTAGTGNASVTVDIWDQAGIEATKTIGVTVPAPAPVRPQLQTVAIAANASSVTENVSNAIIIATTGNHMVFIGGSNDTVSATGGVESIQAYQGRNSITTGTSNDTIRLGGANNTINAGSGNNVLIDNGNNNTIVLPVASQGFDDISGYVMMNGDKFNFVQALAATSWKGNPDMLANFIKITTSGTSAVISIDPTGVAGGATYQIAKLESSGTQSLNVLLSHAIT